MGIGTEGQVDSLRRVTQVEVCRFSETTGADRPELALVTAAAGHIEFVNDQASPNVCHSYVQSEERAARTQISEEEPCQRTPAIHSRKIAFHQPTDSGRFVIFENSRRSDSFQLLLQILGKLNRSKRLANGHFAVGSCLVALENGGVDAE